MCFPNVIGDFQRVAKDSIWRAGVRHEDGTGECCTGFPSRSDLELFPAFSASQNNAGIVDEKLNECADMV